MKQDRIVLGVLVFAAIFMVLAAPATATENRMLLDPDNSVSDGTPVQVAIYTDINETDEATASFFDIEYDPNCIQDFPSYDATGSGWIATTKSNITPGLLRFSTTIPAGSPAVSGHVKVGTLTLTCNNTCCGSFLNFTGNVKYTSGTLTTLYPATDNGTFLCNDPSDPIMTVTKKVWDEPTSSWVDAIGPLGSEWMDKDVRFNITVTAGCLDLSGVAVADVMDVGLEYNNSATMTEDSSTTHTANWTISSLTTGASQSIEFNATIVGYGTNCNTATVTGTVTSLGADAPTVTDSACVTTMPPAGINVTKTVWDESTSSWVDMVTDATIGDTYRFRCEVENIGSPGMDVCDITVIDVLPAGLSYADNAKLQSHHGTWWDIEPPDINDPANNTYGWVVNTWVPGECLQVGQKIVIEYDVTVDNYGLSCNNITAEAYCSAATSWVQDNDSACIDVPKPDLNVTPNGGIKVNLEVPYLADYAFGPVDHPGKRTQPNSISAEVQECNGVDVILPFDVTIVVTNSSTTAVVATGTTTLPGLAGGTSVTVWCNDTWYPTAGWDYTINVTADPADAIPETDETNNTLLRDITAHNHGLKGGSWQSADSNITTLQYHNGTVNLLYSVGDSVSTGSAALQTAQGVYLTNWTAGDFSIPVAGSTIKKARLYVYYNWEKTADRNVTDYFTLDFNGYVLPQDAVYSDIKAPDLPTCGYGCADPIRKYAYPYGMVAYDVTHKFLVNNDNTATLTTDSEIWGNKMVSMTGMLLVVVYENSAERERIIWINEGFDMLKAGEYYYDHTYVGVNTEEATTHAPFTGCPSIETGGKADLVTVVNHPTRSGNLDQEQALYFNGMLLDQDYDVWTRMNPTLEIGINTADVTALLQTTDNIASIQSVDDAAPAGDLSAVGGDWFEASNAFLIVDKAITTMTVEPEPPASGECYEVGEQFDVLINIDPMGNAIRGAQFDLHYNGSVIMVDNFEMGGFLIPPVSISQQSIDNSEDGVASFAAAMTGGAGGATTSGTFVIVHCMAMGQGATSELDLTGVVVYDDTLPIMQPVAVDVYNSSVEVCDNAPPVAVPSSVFTYNNMADKVLSKAYFDGTASYDDDGAITTYEWWFGDGVPGVGPTPEHAFNVRQYWEGGTPALGGHYIDANVTLIVTDDGMPLMDGMAHIDVIVWIGGDANGDGVVNIGDSVMVGYYWGGDSHANEYADRADLNNDGIVNIGDSIPVGFCWGHTAW